MATYADLATAVVEIDETNPGTIGTLYTVPSGTRAKMRVSVLVSRVAQITFGDYILVLTDFPATGTPNVETHWITGEIWLNAGETITTNGSGYTLRALIEEYGNP